MNEVALSLVNQTSRRSVIKSGMVLATGLAVGRQGWAQTPSKTYTRYNVTSPEGQQMLESYKTAITALLALPPTDPRNWYRNAFVHLLDCPHMNWWLFPWHRAYIGWFEQTCREFSGNPNFAFPYWDWTATPMLPTSFATGVLNPANSSFIGNFATFKSQFSSAMNTLWAGLNKQQLAGLATRGYNSMDDVWSDAQNSFFSQSQARSMVPGTPFTGSLAKAVSIDTINAGLKPTTYIPFSSGVTKNHQGGGQGSTIGILEGQPHNLVHNGIGGFMEDFLSPVDPIFFMHHSNLERLWSVWQQKQKVMGLPSAPTAPLYAPWSTELFTFFSAPTGKPVSSNRCGDYATSDLFQDVYTPGSASSVATSARPNPGLLATKSSTFKAALSKDAASNVVGSLTLPAAVTAQPLVANVTVSMPAERGDSLDVYLDLPAGVTASTDRPEFLGTIEFFGMHHHTPGQAATFTLPIPDSLLANKTGQPLHIQVFPSKPRKLNAMPGAMKMQPMKVTAVGLATS